jgi:hypothetical protein
MKKSMTEKIFIWIAYRYRIKLKQLMAHVLDRNLFFVAVLAKYEDLKH